MVIVKLDGCRDQSCLLSYYFFLFFIGVLNLILNYDSTDLIKLVHEV